MLRPRRSGRASPMRPSDATLPVLVLRLTPNPVHHGALGILRSLGRLGVAVYGVNESTRTPAARSRYSHGTIPLPAEPPDPQRLTDYLVGSARRLADRMLLIPIDDAAAIFVADHAEQLRAGFVFPDMPQGLVRHLSSKAEMYELCRTHGVPTPEIAVVDHEDQLVGAAARLAFPLMLKRVAGWLPEPRHGPKMAVARDERELLDRFREMRGEPVANLLLQEYVPGGPETVWMFNGYFDDHSECLFGACGRKLRQYPVGTGVTTFGLCTANPHVHEVTVRFMREIGYRGIVDMGYRYDARDRTYRLLDVNPRIGSTFRLFVGTDGMDVVRALYRDTVGDDVPRSSAVEGRHWLVENADAVASADYIREGALTRMEWLRSLRSVDEAAWLARDDPMPFVAMLARSAATGVRRIGSRRRTRAGGA